MEAAGVALVPVKRLARAKSRLAAVLGPDDRRALVLELMGAVVGACHEAGLRPVVLSDDADVHAAAALLDADALDDGGADLTGSVRRGLRHVRHAPLVLVVAGDLPYVTGGDLVALAAAARPLAVVAAADGTTNAVAARPPAAFTPAYGPGSARRHGGLPVALPGLARDLDTPADLAAWRRTCRV